jgi:methionine-rich copper-binding protein CopC
MQISKTGTWLLCLLALAPSPGLAHAIMVKSAPEQGAAVKEVPAEIRVWFNEEVGEEYAALAVIASDGKRVDNKDGGRDSSDRTLLKASLSSISPGSYLVRWRVLSADGHVVSGKYEFELQ